MASAGDNTDNVVIVGIDFGTTYSGVAFTWSKKVDNIEVISSWETDQHSNTDEYKTPTALSFGAANQVSWGAKIPFDAEQAKWFKLLLIDEEDLPDEVRHSAKIEQARAYLKKHNITSVGAIALYLRHLWNHSVQRISETVSRELVHYSRFHIVMTLPAIWPEYARSRMRDAVEQAGMLDIRPAGKTDLTFVSEPEAAAFATLADMEGRCDIKAGDTFVVADCGGGSADLISYEVVSISPMVVKECVKGQGGLCGAVFVDEAFVNILRREFGWQKWSNMPIETRNRLLHDEWENGIKMSFDGREAVWKIGIPFECLGPDSLTFGKPLPKITITAGDVRSAFGPSLEKIRTMVDEQVAAVSMIKRKNPKYVILVGGFGRCNYLFTAVEEHLGHDIQVLQSRGSKPWTAICRGGVIHAASAKSLSAFPIQVETRISRISCGVFENQYWDPTKHLPADKFWNDKRQTWMAKDQMVWLLKMGDDISATKPSRCNQSILFEPGEAAQTRYTDIMFSSTSGPLPGRLDDSIKVLCTIKWDAEIVISSLPTFTNRLGKVFHMLEYGVEMSCVGGSLDFAVYHNGKRQGSKHVVVDYETRY